MIDNKIIINKFTWIKNEIKKERFIGLGTLEIWKFPMLTVPIGPVIQFFSLRNYFSSFNYLKT